MRTAIEVGRRGRLELDRGFYIYVGSAFGPGGVRARVARHFRIDKPTRWHVDYLRPHVEPVGALSSYAPTRLEHEWAGKLTGLERAVPVPRFGCSDCACATHLCFMPERPDIAGLRRCLGDAVFSRYVAMPPSAFASIPTN